MVPVKAPVSVERLATVMTGSMELVPADKLIGMYGITTVAPLEVHAPVTDPVPDDTARVVAPCETVIVVDGNVIGSITTPVDGVEDW